MLKQIQRIAVLALAITVVPVWAQKSEYQPSPVSPATNSSDASQKSAAQDPNYVIGSQDVLDISVWKEAELTRVVPVRPDGKISLPLLNDVQAAGLTPMQLAADLTLKLKRFVAAPRVTVVVTQMNSQRVYVLGEVVHTGPVLLIPGMTVLQALATSGFSQFANTKAIYILRSERGDQQRLPFNYKQVVRGEAMDQNIVLKPGDTIVVP